MKTQPILRATTMLAMALALAAGLWGAMPAPVARAATCTSTGTGNWSESGTWSGCGEGVPGASDDVIIQSGHTVTVDVDSSVNNITLLGANSGTRLTLNAVLTIWGTMNADVTNPTTILITGSGSARFVGESRALFGTNWGANPPGWNLEIALNADAVGTASTNVKAGTIIVNSGTFQVGSTGNTRDLRPDNGSDYSGVLVIDSGATLIVYGYISRTGTETAQCASITVDGTLQLGGRYISAVNINVNNGGWFRSTRAAGHTVTGSLTYAVGSTLEYAGTAAQTTGSELTSSIYNLVVNNTSGVSLSASPTINGDLTIGSGARLNANGWNITLAGNWTNSGTFTAGSNVVTFYGDGEQTIGGNSVTAFNNLTINNSAIVVIPTDNTPTVSTALTNNGALRQRRTVDSTTTTFLNISTDRYYGVVITPTADMGDTSVTISGNQFCPNATSGVKRCFDIEPGSSETATVRFYFTEAERNGQTLGSLKVWHWSGGAWVQQIGSTTTGGSGNSQWVQVTGVNAYSPFLLSENTPTAVKLARFEATPQDNAIRVTWETASELNNVGFNLYRSESMAGPYTQLNDTLIPPQFPGEVMGGDYEWLDTDLQPGVTYYYKLEDVDVKGMSTFHGPISTAVMSTPAAVQLRSVSTRGLFTSLALGAVMALGLASLYHGRRLRST